LSASDAEVLAKSLVRLPGDDEYNLPVTVDLNGQVAVRGQAADQQHPTELVLPDSSTSGEPVRLNMNRKYLARALKLGFSEVHVFGNNVPVLCRDDHRQYVWALLDPASAIAPSSDAIRIESPPAAVASPNRHRKPTRRTPVVNPSPASPNGTGPATKSNRQPRKGTRPKAGDQGINGLIEQAEKLRTALHDLSSQAGGLVKALKQHRRESRAIQSTLESIRQLKGLGV
jgi:hypothetical protein